MAGFGMVPFYRPWYDDVERSHSLFDQFFGQPLLDEDLFSPFGGQLDPYYSYWPGDQRRQRRSSRGQLAPMRPTFDRLRSGLSQVTNDKNEFKVSLDVQQFKPEEINVKTDDKYVTIEGKHQEKPDEHGYVQRHFVRKYMLPEGVKPETVKCDLSSDGVLSIRAPKQQALEQGQKERAVPITHSPHPAIQQQHQHKGSQEKDKPGEKMQE